VDGAQLGVLSLGEALTMARTHAVDLVEIAPNATPPVCRLVDFGKYRYEQAKRDKESKKHQHANRVKEVQLSPKIDPHDLGVKTVHAIDFLCEDMKVKVTLKFRGRENAHTEVGFQVVKKFLADIAPYGHPDFPPKLAGRAINVMISPLAKNKRAKHPGHAEAGNTQELPPEQAQSNHRPNNTVPIERPAKNDDGKSVPAFSNNPFAQLEAKR
jgi:translation initiation factor IF-3